MGTDGGLEEVLFSQLLDSQRLPSGHPFELMPDTVDIALRVAEADDTSSWKKKLLQVLAVTKSIANKVPSEEGGINFLGSLPDTDIICLALAWTAEMNDRTMTLDNGVPCPQCATDFTSIPLGNLKVMARPEAPSGPGQFHEVDVPKSVLPSPLTGLMVGEPTWLTARSKVPENSWDNMEVILIHRTTCCLYTKASDSKNPVPRAVTKAEYKQLRMKVIREIQKTMDVHVPHFKLVISMVCKTCGLEVDIPFDQAV